ncbi:MAG: hypothetical protein COB37_07205 [Kordiimonadales bacterium]|nr:MAG: hypothetical protein COB37_07205 [Kordiimonadales bacterium]
MYKAFKTTLIAASVTLAGFTSATASEVIFVQKNSAYSTAVKAMMAGKLDKASRYYKRALKHGVAQTRISEGYNNLCAVDYARGDYEAAEDACNKAIANNRTYWRAYVNRSNVRVALGQNDLAMADAEKAASLKPANRIVKRVLANLQSGTQLASFGQPYQASN